VPHAPCRPCEGQRDTFPTNNTSTFSSFQLIRTCILKILHLESSTLFLVLTHTLSHTQYIYHVYQGTASSRCENRKKTRCQGTREMMNARVSRSIKVGERNQRVKHNRPKESDTQPANKTQNHTHNRPIMPLPPSRRTVPLDLSPGTFVRPRMGVGGVRQDAGGKREGKRRSWSKL